MSLLIFAATARLEQPPGRDLDRFLRALSTELPHRFVLPVTLEPPAQTRPELSWDWVTLPATAVSGLQSTMLSAYADWLKPTVSVFWGEEVRRWHRDCSGHFGQRWLVSETTADSLLPRLRPLLPLLWVLNHPFDPRAFEEALTSCDPSTPVQVHCPEAFGAAGREALEQIRELHSGPVKLLLPLKHALLRSRSAAGDLAFLFRNRSRIELTVCDELGTPVPEALNKLWTRLDRLL